LFDGIDASVVAHRGFRWKAPKQVPLRAALLRLRSSPCVRSASIAISRTFGSAATHTVVKGVERVKPGGDRDADRSLRRRGL
jgi:hypothetical protein